MPVAPLSVFIYPRPQFPPTQTQLHVTVASCCNVTNRLSVVVTNSHMFFLCLPINYQNIDLSYKVHNMILIHPVSVSQTPGKSFVTIKIIFL
jgi:hypothetical protein